MDGWTDGWDHCGKDGRLGPAGDAVNPRELVAENFERSERTYEPL